MLWTRCGGRRDRYCTLDGRIQLRQALPLVSRRNPVRGTTLELMSSPISSRFYACGQHRCEGGLCHPHEEPTNVTCPRDPSQVSTCPCGKTPLAALLPSGQGRESCTSPIPTCDRTPCGKVIPDCGHLCRKTCHSGPCDPCTEDVVLVCRCGSDKITRRCQDLKDEAARDEAEEFRCAQKCRAMLHCRKHICGQRVRWPDTRLDSNETTDFVLRLSAALSRSKKPTRRPRGDLRLRRKTKIPLASTRAIGHAGESFHAAFIPAPC
jgi:hypothetical protein